MSLSELTSGIAAAMDAAKANLAEVNAKIDAKKAALRQVEMAPPHTDDLVAACRRGLAQASASYEQRLGWFLNSANLREGDAAGMVQRAAPSLMMVGSTPPEVGRGQIFPHSGLGQQQRDIDVAAVTYFLRDRIEAELPALIGKLCPLASSGMKEADRKAAVRAAEAELRTLEEEKQRLTDEINEAIKAVGPRR